MIPKCCEIHAIIFDHDYKLAQKCLQIVHLKSGSEINPERETARVSAVQRAASCAYV